MESSGPSNRLLSKRNLIIFGIVLIVGIFAASNALTKEITIQDNDKEIKVKAMFATVEEVLVKGKVALKEHDQISVPLKNDIKDGMKVVIKRAHPINLIADGKTMEIMTANEEVKDILKEYKVSVGKYDKVEPAIEAKVSKYETITVVRVNEEIITEVASIPYQSIIKFNDDLDKSKVNVIEKGKNGEKQVKIRIIYEDGKEVGKEVIEERVIAQPVDEIVEKGTAQFIATSRGTTRFQKKIVMSSTAYDAGFASTGKKPGDKHYGITRSGTRVRPGVVAVDPRVIPLGTKLYIKSLDKWPDYGFAVAEDTGGAIKGNKIDLFYEDGKVVDRYGRRKVEVYILGK